MVHGTILERLPTAFFQMQHIHACQCNGVKHFRDAMAQDAMADEWAGNKYFIHGTEFDGEEWRTETLRMLAYYKSESQRLKESTSLLELAMWKMKLDAGMDQDEAMGGGNKKMKMDTLDFRLQCRISCGADNVVANVWPFLLPPDLCVINVRYDDDDED